MPSSTLSMTDKSGVSVVICCHNSAARLPETLKHLARQQLPNSIFWEVILVNNKSTDDTASVAQQCWEAEGSPAPMHIDDEPKLGLSYAREQGIRNSHYDILVFVDDDNWLADDYIRIASELMVEKPRIGALGGHIAPTYEKIPPPWFNEVQANFAIGRQAHHSGDITDEKPFLAGAGIVLRKSAYDDVSGAGFNFLLSGRTGAEASSGEDTELCYAMALRGYRIWYDDRLKLEHFMPARRLTPAATFNLNRNINKAAVYCSVYDMALKDEQAPVSRYCRDLLRMFWWCLKAVGKFLLGKQHLLAVELQFQSLLVRISEFPRFRRVFREHYSRILALRGPARS
jgi:glycosyltransferase involved in cell wall biosynthesis